MNMDRDIENCPNEENDWEWQDQEDSYDWESESFDALTDGMDIDYDDWDGDWDALNDYLGR